MSSPMSPSPSAQQHEAVVARHLEGPLPIAVVLKPPPLDPRGARAPVGVGLAGPGVGPGPGSELAEVPGELLARFRPDGPLAVGEVDQFEERLALEVLGLGPDALDLEAQRHRAEVPPPGMVVGVGPDVEAEMGRLEAVDPLRVAVQPGDEWRGGGEDVDE